MQRRNLVKSVLCLTGAGTVGTIAMMSGRAQSVARAPEFSGIDSWLNTSVPVAVSGLRGKVVLVNFWTYSCINCQRTIPYLKRWQTEYGPLGFQVIGIEAPEFGFEHARPNVETYIRETRIPYPVGQDNDFQTWNEWNNQAWPGFFLLDRDGGIVLERYGEDNAHEMESVIRGLLGLARTGPFGLPSDDPDLSRIGSPEMYFGSAHPTPQASGQSPRLGEATYSFAQTDVPRLNEYVLDGVWSREGEKLVLGSSRGGLRFRFSAAQLFLVAGASETATIRVRVDGQEARSVEVTWPTLYTLVDGKTYGEHLLELKFDTTGLTLYSMTFG
jgi:thiol-disulfide isomerase/thioredoxin